MNYYSNKELKKIKFYKLGKNVIISRQASIINPELLSIGDFYRIDDFCVLFGDIKICRNVHITPMCLNVHITPMCLVGSGLNGIRVSDFCTLGYNVKIFSQSVDYVNGLITNSIFSRRLKKEKFAKVFLGKDVIIGASSIIMLSCKL
jgi:acetyltransferase-like isoleucine patch superfamily enzyme